MKKTFQISSIFGMIFKISFSLGFSFLIDFGQNFSIGDFDKKGFNTEIYQILFKLLIGFLILTLLYGIINHTKLLWKGVNKSDGSNKSLLYGLIAFCSPWILSLLLIVNGKIFLNILNW
jgi:hypothetical protein